MLSDFEASELWESRFLNYRHQICIQHTLFHCASFLLCFVDTVLFFFYKLKVYEPLNHRISTIFPTVLTHFVSLCHVLVILSLFQQFVWWSRVLWWSVVCDLWCYYCCCVRRPQTVLISDSELTGWMFHEFYSSADWPFLTPSTWAFLVPRTQQH